MALGKKCDSKVKRGGVKAEEGLGFTRCRRALGTKRVVIWDAMEDLTIDSTLGSPLKKRRNLQELDQQQPTVDGDWSLLQSLPRDIMIRVVCGVNHDDLKQLFHVSKSVREATLIAKELHFAYSTPSKTRAFRTSVGFEIPSESDEIEAPNAPKQTRVPRSRVGQKKMSDIVVALFGSEDEGEWPRR